ncbi:hypothetical protein QBC45DRAFT_322223, partial [Copromyces sp. CBS 386.78]
NFTNKLLKRLKLKECTDFKLGFVTLYKKAKPDEIIKVLKGYLRINRITFLN